MSALVVAGDVSGTCTLQAPSAAGSTVLTLPVIAADTLAGIAATQTLTNKTLTAPVLSGSLTGTYTLAGTPTISSPSISSAVMTTMASSVITSGTAQATTSGTFKDFTSIPSWVKRITVMFNGVSTSGTTAMRVQLGTGVTPTYSATYVSIVGAIAGGTAASSSFTDGFAIQRTAVAAALYSGTIVCTRLSTNVWTYTSNIGTATSTIPSYGGGSVDLGAVATAVRLYMDGTDTFDAGSVNILYE